MKALAGGAQGFAYLSRVLSVLLQTLLQDEIAEVSPFSTRLNIKYSCLMVREQTLLRDGSG